ncbi:hypothetical protein Pfo_020597 [Paulownia fortunei]|nr:hypothetical protein Pfo_020597 [Paulownia fortunei]
MVVDLNSAAAEEDGEAAAPLLALPTCLIEWDKIHHSPRDTAVSPPPRTPWPMVSIRNYQDHSSKNPPIVFPPINHENLQISSNPPHIHTDNASIASPMYNQENSDSDSDSDLDSDSVTNSNSSSSFSPSESSPVSHSPLFSSPKARPIADAASWFGSWTEILHSKVNGIVRYLWASFASSRGVFLSFSSATLTVVLIVFLYFRQRRRLRVGEESRARLIGIIEERDEKIKQLLDQISGMNQVLLTLHRVPTSPST